MLTWSFSKINAPPFDLVGVGLLALGLALAGLGVVVASVLYFAKLIFIRIRNR
jgi:hypothetical protein